MAAKDRDSWTKRLLDDARTAMSAPDFWPMLGMFVGMLAAFGLFFWLAVGFDAMSHIHNKWSGACRKLGDWQSFVLFVSPFAIGLACMVACGEFISQLERKNRWGRPMRWGKVFWTFGLAMGLLSAVGVLMAIWC